MYNQISLVAVMFEISIT